MATAKPFIFMVMKSLRFLEKLTLMRPLDAKY